jgi:hypothetical protein
MTTTGTGVEPSTTPITSVTSLTSSPTVLGGDARQTSRRPVVPTGGVVGIVLGVITIVCLAAGLFWYVDVFIVDNETSFVTNHVVVSVHAQPNPRMKIVIV